MTKPQILMNKRVSLGLLILDLSKTIMYEFLYENSKLCYIDTGSFIAHVKIDDIYKDIAEEVETRFDTVKFEIDQPLPKKKLKINWINER